MTDRFSSIEYKKKIRIKEKQLQYLKQNKEKNGCVTMAQFLDKIIKEYQEKV